MFKKIIKKNFVVVFSSAAMILVVGGFAWAFFSLRSIGTDLLILHFNDINNITNVGGLRTIVFMGVLGILVVAMNFAIARELSSRDHFLGKFLAAMTLLFAALLFIAFAAIINVNV